MLLLRGAKSKTHRKPASKSKSIPEDDPKFTMKVHIDKNIQSCVVKGDIIINVYPSVHAPGLLKAIDRIAATLPESERNDAKRVLHECLA